MSIGITAPQGFIAAGVAGGIKENGAKDCAVIVSVQAANSAGVFTTNLVKAAPVKISILHLSQASSSKAVVFTSGNANAATGQGGIEIAQSICESVAREIGCEDNEILIGQTGLIGIPLDKETACSGVVKAVQVLNSEGGVDAAQAMRTTDTVAKYTSTSYEDNGVTVTVGGAAKGSGMLAPSMATMLAVLTTDASVAPPVLQTALRDAVDESFHMIMVDAQSTNDTVFILANGMSQAAEITSVEHPSYKLFYAALVEVARTLALAMVADAEGASKTVAMRVDHAATVSDARVAARAVVASPLVKCSLAGEDPYWGRVLSELGASGAAFDPDKVTIRYGEHTVYYQGEIASLDQKLLAQYMKNSHIDIYADLWAGQESATVYGTDLTHIYIDENMKTS